MFKQLNDKINYHELESGIRKFWDENNIFKKSIDEQAGRPQFTFYEGPPTANGRPGIHHVMARALKDIVCRYKTMQGYQVPRKAGWDTHGLPVEIEVEKALGFKHKDDIVKYGVAKFNEDCRKSVWKYKADWEEMTKSMGYWVDLDHPYVTFENNYIESIWWALQQYFDQGLIYKGYKIQPYCPRCETPLSSHEVSLGYKDVKDLSIYIKLKVKGEENTYFLVWTTTPWTLISNVAIAVHPEVDYVKVEHKDQKIILAEARLSVLGDEYTVLEKLKGTDLAGKEYDRMFSFHNVKEKGWYVVLADFVTTEEGSGIVHMAPAYGEDDYQIGRKYGLPTIHPVNKSGEFDTDVPPFAGKFVKDADAEIVADLKHRGILYKKEMHQHSYPHCWRCSSPLLYYARESWYIRTTEYAQRMIDLNKEINWIPPEVGSGRFGNWLEENKDWALSRDRFWGTPLPIWICESCGKQKCIGSIEELKKGKGIEERVDLHKPHVDRVTFDCSCGGVMRRTPELIDVWFDSGSMPFAQWHYPFENKEIFEKSYPADFISEGIDQTRGWFYTLHSIGSFLFKKPAFKNVLVNELILDKQGQKMSKTKKNSVDPIVLIQKYGADAVRWYLIAQSPPWRTTLFDEEGIGEVQRKFFSTLVNTYSFFALYANIDGFTGNEPILQPPDRQEIDRWILSALNSLVKEYRTCMEKYDLTKAARAVSDFTIDYLSNWYVRRNRRRFWKGEIGKDKTAAYQTLYECLSTLTQLLAPFAPFLAETLYQNIGTANKGTKLSVHLDAIPEVRQNSVDLELEHWMEHAMRIVGIVRAMRMKSNLKVRQPLQKILIPVKDESESDMLERVKDIILEETNVKELDVKVSNDIIKYKIKPNFKVLGQKHGKQTSKIAERIRSFNPMEISKLDVEGFIEIEVDGKSIAIQREDADIITEDIEGWLVGQDGSLTVALETELTPELVQEGLAREFVNRIQNMRKDAGFEVTDRITIYHHSSEPLAKVLTLLRDYIAQETLAVDICSLSLEEAKQKNAKEEDINGEQTALAVEKK